MNLVLEHIKYRVYESVEQSFERILSYEELVCVLLEEYQQRSFTETVTQEIVVGYFFFSMEKIIAKVDTN